MNRKLSKYEIVNQTFNDFEEFACITKLWDFDFRQIDRGEFKAQVLQISSQDFQVGEGRFNRKLDQMGSSPRGLRTFAILSDKSTPTIWRGDLADQQSIMIFPEDGELEAFSDPGFDVLTLSFSENLLLEVVDMLGVSPPEDLIRGPEVAVSNPKTLSQLRETISNVLSEVALTFPRMTLKQIQYEIEYEIPRSLILSLQRESRNRKKPSSHSRYTAVRRVREYIESNVYDSLTVRDLCRVAGVSERTLRYAFEENLGVPPKTFVNIIRLNRVRQDLKRTNSDNKNIADIANHWGFWHMGQFAADYRRLFGELPSETNRAINIAGI